MKTRLLLMLMGVLAFLTSSAPHANEEWESLSADSALIRQA